VRTRRTFIAEMIGGLAGTTLTTAIASADWPDHPIHIVVPFPPGGGADLDSRLLAMPLQQILGQPIVVENRSGAAGRIGTAYVAKSEPDGETLLVTTESSIVIAPHSGVVMNYDPLNDLVPVSLLTRNAILLVVHPSVRANTLQEFMALAKAQPGQLTYGSSGVGGPNHLAGETFKRMTGLNITHVPFQGTGAALQGIIAGQVNAMWGFMAGLLPQVWAGTVRPLAIGGKQRSAAVPDVPTFDEAGVPAYEAISWVGMFVPRGVDAAVVNKLAASVKSAMDDRHVKEVLAQDGSEIVAMPPAEFRQVVASDYDKYGKLSDVLKAAQ
jgi:tripartite-type tricarboxylate transporter receptor subunit TctC